MKAGSRGRIVLGLMSGTSHDGVDAALTSLGRKGASLIHHHYKPYPRRLRQRVLQAPESDTATITRLDFDLGEFFASAALECLEASGLKAGEVEAVASHGQTICHIPPTRGRSGATMQIGSPGVIARRTGLKVVADFRAADIAAGGQGAPLVPFADRVLFGHLAPCAVHNIGGISNVTVIPRKGDMMAFDTGPGNSLMDEAMRVLYSKPYDRGGAIARMGRADEALLRELMTMPYLRKRPPKSTGKELFGPALIARLLADIPADTGDNSRTSSTSYGGLEPQDIICTLAHFTARSIAMAYRRFVVPHAEVGLAVFAGGGTCNGFLMELIRAELAPLEVRLSDDFGVPSGAREAMSFAILAGQTLRGRPSNVPSATGATHHAVLGSITPAPA